jgi:hypothetical protein
MISVVFLAITKTLEEKAECHHCSTYLPVGSRALSLLRQTNFLAASSTLYSCCDTLIKSL